MKSVIQQAYPYFRNIRQQIHANPELRCEEYRTAELIAKELAILDLMVQTGIQHANKMHACGHDGHTAALLFAAHVLSKMRDQFTGKIKFLFQPAEEGGAGAQAMIEAGALENPCVDAIFAFHNYPGYETGTIFTREDCVMYGNTEFTLTIQGKSGHAAMPNLAIDPITIGSMIVQNLQNLVRQLSDPTAPIIISITCFNSGIASNIIPEFATLSGTIRFESAACHNARYDFNDAILPIATEILCQIVINYLTVSSTHCSAITLSSGHHAGIQNAK